MFDKVVKGAKLVSLPDLYLKLKALMDEPDYTMAEVAILVGRDPGMTVRFLKAVNNPLNRRVCNIDSVSHAVSLLGVHQVHDIVLTAAVAEAFDGLETEVMDMKKFWKRSFYCAVVTKQLALDVEAAESDRMFVTGLLHDLGHLFMYLSIPDESRQAILQAREKTKYLHLVERELIGFDYAVLGGYMMKQWGLPKIFQVVTCFHPEPGKAVQFALETALVHLGAHLAHSELEDGVFGEGSFTVDPTALEATGLTLERCLDIRKIASEQFAEVEQSLVL
jgi:HD-like signal output (HDOD) protein